MNKKTLLIAVSVAWVGTLFAAYLVGKSGSEVTATTGGSNQERNGGEEAGSRLTALGSDPSSRSDARRKGGPDLAVGSSSAIEQLQRSLENSNPVERMRQFMEAVALMDGDDFKAALEALGDDIKRGENRKEIGLLLYAWAEQDGAGALSHLESFEMGREGWSLYQSALNAWGGTEPEAAAEWALKKHEGKNNNENYYMVGVINGMAKSDPVRAGQLAQGIGFGRARGDALGTVVGELFKQGDDAAKNWIESMGEGDEVFRGGAAGRVASQIARKDPQAAADWVMGLGIAEKEKAIASVAQTWGWRAPEEAASWAASIDDPKLRSEGIESVVESWARKDADAAGTWLGQMPASPELDRPVRSYAFMVRERDPGAAITWANTITDDKMRGETVTRIGGEWMRRNPDEAKAFLQEQEDVPEGLQRFLK